MATLALTSSPSSPSGNRRRKSFLRKCERYCCNVITYFPLSFVYGLTSWAVWVQTKMGMIQGGWIGYFEAGVGIAFYILLNWSYTTAVFTDPGSPINTTPGYSSLPTTEPAPFSSLTVKSSGEMRFCKKCQSKKPDRSHHCSTCRRCVLKMDHHCPWLATCVGLRNYKAFLLFLIYSSLFCWLCFLISAQWIWESIIMNGQVEESLMPVNFILLSVLSGIIGLVITGFTAWHLYLTIRGTTTIESLEKTRYLSPLKASMSNTLSSRRTYVDEQNHSLGEQLRDFGQALAETHANSLPGVLRPEEGEERMSPAQSSLQRTYDWDNAERRRERDRYNEYLDELDNEKLPNAFDYGWRRNLTMVMGEDKWTWFLPICNSLGDGWVWEPSSAWKEAAERLRLRREDMVKNQEFQNQLHDQNQQRQRLPPPARQPISGLSTPRDGHSGMGTDDYDTSSDEESTNGRTKLLKPSLNRPVESWNDLPEDMVNGRRRSPRGSRGPSRMGR